MKLKTVACKPFVLAASFFVLVACDETLVSDANDAGRVIVDANTMLAADAGTSSAFDSGVMDAGTESLLGPIPPPTGTSTAPEEGEFVWSGIEHDYISASIPRSYPDWTECPRYGTARLLPYSSNEKCVCFDVNCEACNQANCGLATCNYDLNDSHTLTKYKVELRSIEQADLVVEFEVNISFDPAITYTDISEVLNRLERFPVAYWPGLMIITHFGDGIQFLHESYFNGASAYGSRSYIDTQTANLPTLLHELGHTMEQYTRLGNVPTLEPQSNILNPVWRHAIRSDNVRTSGYGNNNEWEDLAEFAMIYAMAITEGRLAELQAFSPERYRIWERILSKASSIEY